MNPGGIWAGAKLGYKIGSAAQSFVKECMPQNTVVKCDAKQVALVTGKIVAGHYVGKFAGKYATKYT